MRKVRWFLGAGTAAAVIVLMALATVFNTSLGIGGRAVIDSSAAKAAGGKGAATASAAESLTSSSGEVEEGKSVEGNKQLRVHVSGLVAKPGLYVLDTGARVNDAVSAAGGFLPEADQSSVNLAALVRDEQQIIVRPPGAAGTVVNLNTADVRALQSISGIGRTLAKRIIAWREKHGAFRRVDDLQKVSGVGRKLFESIKDQVTL